MDHSPMFVCGLYCNVTCSRYMFTIYNTDVCASVPLLQQVAWSDNRNKPITFDEDLGLKDSNETIVWFTNSSGKR